MTVLLPPLLFRVRSSVAEISIENMDDLTMYRELIKANVYVNAIKKAAATDEQLETPIVCLAAYYAHVTYTLLNSRQLGTIDEGVIIRGRELKRIARAMLLTITDQALDDNLVIDNTRYQKLGGIAFATTNGILNDKTW